MHYAHAAPIAVEAGRPDKAARFGTGPGQVERRAGPRTPMVFTIGKLMAAGVEHPCMVRNLSDRGMQIQMPAPPPVGMTVMIEMRGMRPTAARVRWSADQAAGLQFDQPCDVPQVFEARTNRDCRLTRSPRFALAKPCLLHLDDISFPVLAADISVGGARLVSWAPITPGRPARIVLALASGDRSMEGTICWNKDNAHGFRFAQPLSSITLALALRHARA